MASYDLPIRTIDSEQLANMLGAEIDDIKVNITMEKVSGQLAEQIAAKAIETGALLLTDAIEFKVTAEANGKKVEVSNFGNTYISRSVVIAEAINSSNATGALYNPETGEYTFVPSTFTMVDGKTQVTMKRPGNSIYTVIEFNKTFDDLNGHWAKSDIELLASKLVIKGTTETNFAPDANITRAQFATLLVRALGLSEDNVSANFSDVAASDWYAGAIGVAVKEGLVTGFKDGTFAPNEEITREQMAVMVSRALKVASKDVDVEGKQAELLGKFVDQASISAWAQTSVAQTIEAGIITGMTSDTFSPNENANRAQAAVMLKRLLQYVKFIN
jgi:hypothetical protein